MIELLLGLMCLALAIGLICVLLITLNLGRRYERFRHETGQVLARHQNNIADHDQRLRRLGSPSIQPVPSMEELASAGE